MSILTRQDLLYIIPHDMLLAVFQFLDVSSIFSLKLTAKVYAKHQIIKNDLHDYNLRSIHLDAISLGYIDLVKLLVVPGTDPNPVVLRLSYTQTAAKYGQLDILKHLYEIGCRFDSDASDDAIKNGHLDIVKWLHENGCNWGWWGTRYAVCNGHLDIVKYLHHHGRLIGYTDGYYNDMYYGVARNGHLEVLKYMFEVMHIPFAGYHHPSVESICSYSVKSGNLDMVKYLRTKFYQNGRDWDKTAYSNAEEGGHCEILKYLHENGCPR